MLKNLFLPFYSDAPNQFTSVFKPICAGWRSHPAKELLSESQSKASSDLQTLYTNCNTNHFIAANTLYILKYNYLINSENGS